MIWKHDAGDSIPRAREAELKIALLLSDLRAGGVERVRLLLAREFLAMGHEVEFVLRVAEGSLRGEAPAGAGLHSLDCARFRDVLPRLVGYLRARPPDALMAAMWPMTGIACAARRLSGADFRLLVSEHTDFREAPSIKPWERRLLRRFGRLVYGQADAVVAVSGGVAEGLAEVAGLDRSGLKVIHNPVRPLPRLELGPGQRKELSWWLAAPHKLITIGSLKPPKAYHDLIDAVALLRRSADARLLILGEGPLRAQLEDRIARLGLGEAVRMPGFVPEPFPILAAADLFVMSSVREGFPNVLTEALACGVPVVSTDCRSGPREILADGRYGRLVPMRDPQALAAGIAASLEENADRDALRRRGGEFTAAGAARKYLAALATGARGGGAGSRSGW
ncbi:MAG: glycosyltransferase [Sphingomonadaceae bacterium]